MAQISIAVFATGSTRNLKVGGKDLRIAIAAIAGFSKKIGIAINHHNSIGIAEATVSSYGDLSNAFTTARKRTSSYEGYTDVY